MDQELNIVVNAIDESESALAAVAEGLDAVGIAGDEMATSLSESSASVDSSIAEMESSLAVLNQEMAMDSDDISEKALAVGVSFDEAATMVSESANLMEMACAAVAASAAAAAVESDESFATMGEGMKSSALQAGIVAGIVFEGLKSEITDASEAGEKWNQTISTINTELQNTGSSLPTSALVNYADQLSKITLFSQQDVLSSEALIASHSELQSSYQTITATAADLAQKTGQDLPAATAILVKALNDPLTGLRQLQSAGLDFSATAVRTVNALAQGGDTAGASAILMAALKDQINGVAEAAAKAPGSGMTELGNQLNTMQILIGEDLNPVLDKLAKAIEPVITQIDLWIEAHPKLTAYILIGIAALAALTLAIVGVGLVIGTVIVSFGAIATALGAVAASPIALFIAAVTGIGAASFLMYEAIKNNFGGIRDTIESILSGLTTTIQSWYNNIMGWITSIINAMKNIGSAIGGGISGAIGGAVSGVESLIPKFAAGGIVSSPTIGLIGEAGPEAIIPLSMLGSSDGGTLGGNNGGINITLTGNTLYTTAQQAKQLGDAIARQINQQLKLKSW